MNKKIINTSSFIYTSHHAVVNTTTHAIRMLHTDKFRPDSNKMDQNGS